MSSQNRKLDAKGKLIVCRCERVPLQKIRACIHRQGARTVNQVKKLTRAGMGPCQGRTCARIIQTLVKSEAAGPTTDEPFQARPPVRGVSLAAMATGADEFKDPEGPVSVSMLRAGQPEIPEDGGTDKK